MNRSAVCCCAWVRGASCVGATVCGCSSCLVADADAASIEVRPDSCGFTARECRAAFFSHSSDPIGSDSYLVIRRSGFQCARVESGGTSLLFTCLISNGC